MMKCSAVVKHEMIRPANFFFQSLSEVKSAGWGRERRVGLGIGMRGIEVWSGEKKTDSVLSSWRL